LLTGLSDADLQAAEREVNRRRHREQFTTLSPVATESAGGVFMRRSLSQLEDGGDPVEAPLAVPQEMGPLVEEARGGGAGGEERRRHTLRTFQRCEVPHSAGSAGVALLRFETLSLVSAASSLAFIYRRRRLAAQRTALL